MKVYPMGRPARLDVHIKGHTRTSHHIGKCFVYVRVLSPIHHIGKCFAYVRALSPIHWLFLATLCANKPTPYILGEHPVFYLFFSLFKLKILRGCIPYSNANARMVHNVHIMHYILLCSFYVSMRLFSQKTILH